ncbi:MAG: cell envelope integrity protein CreD, partial [Bacteroidota bacterium]|nr:cell envelope integrity protein CreD [Bacteroidota bacterium]
NSEGYSGMNFQKLKLSLLLLAGAVLAAALVSAFYFTWRRASKNNLPVWDRTARLLTINMLIPLVTGGLLILALLRYDEWRFVAPLSLIFYGLASVNGSKYTLSDIRYLGILEIILGLINAQFIGYGLYFWAAGFGALHIMAFMVFVKGVLQSRRLSMLLSMILFLLYSYVFTILQLQDYALLLGSIGLFITLGIVMYCSRKLQG